MSIFQKSCDFIQNQIDDDSIIANVVVGCVVLFVVIPLVPFLILPVAALAAIAENNK